jgi:predicted Rossmann fold nucleotide-binding protein DprA/Smf involved in DNA uptake
MENTKKTKAMYFAELREIVEANAEVENQAELLEFIDKQIETLEKRKAAAAERAEKKKSESDALTEAVFAQIGEDFITVDEIVEALGEEDITRNKVTARLGKLVKSGAVVKELVKTDNGKRMAYHLA